MHASLNACIVLYTQIGVVYFPDSIETFIYLIQPNLAEIWAKACKHIACMHASLLAQVKLCAQRGVAFSSDSIYTLMSLIQPNLAEIWACVLGDKYVLRKVGPVILNQYII